MGEAPCYAHLVDDDGRIPDPPDIRIQRIYDTTTSSTGTRILVDCLWPWGVRKDQARIDRSRPWHRPTRCVSGSATIRRGGPSFASVTSTKSWSRTNGSRPAGADESGAQRANHAHVRGSRRRAQSGGCPARSPTKMAREEPIPRVATELGAGSPASPWQTPGGGPGGRGGSEVQDQDRALTDSRVMPRRNLIPSAVAPTPLHRMERGRG